MEGIGMSNYFYPNDKVKINLETSGLYGFIGIVTNPRVADTEVLLIDKDGKERKYFYWNDELILLERTWGLEDTHGKN